MVRKTSETITRLSTGKAALAALLLFVAFTALVLPGQAEQSETYAGEAGSPDQSFLYSPDELYQMAEAYGPEGRSSYIRARFTFDLVWPLVYMAFLATGLGWLSGKLFAHSNRWQYLVLLPLLGGLFDYLENIAAAAVMARYPDPTPLAAITAPIFTVLKWSLIGASFAALLALVILWVVRRSWRARSA